MVDLSTGISWCFINDINDLQKFWKMSLNQRLINLVKSMTYKKC